MPRPPCRTVPAPLAYLHLTNSDGFSCRTGASYSNGGIVDLTLAFLPPDDFFFLTGMVPVLVVSGKV